MHHHQWEYTSVHLNAQTLQSVGDTLALPDLAKRLSQAIIEVVNEKKADRWQMMNMDFNAGQVTIQFRRYVQLTAESGQESPGQPLNPSPKNNTPSNTAFR